MNEHSTQRSIRDAPLVDQARNKIDHAHFTHERGIEADLVDAIQDFGSRSRQLFAMNWIDVNDNDVLAVAIVNQWKQGRVAHVTTIPIMLSTDFNSLEHVRQTSRGKDAVNGDVFVFE